MKSVQIMGMCSTMENVTDSFMIEGITSGDSKFVDWDFVQIGDSIQLDVVVDQFNADSLQILDIAGITHTLTIQ